MTESVSERDLITLNAYLDGELSATEQAAFEQRLVQEPALRAELDSTRVTVALLGMAERIRAPRSFALDPARYGRPASASIWSRLGLPSAVAAAVGAFAILLICVGALVFAGSGASPGIGQVAMQAAMESDTASEAPGEKVEGEAADEMLAEEALEAPAAAAPAEPDALEMEEEEEAPTDWPAVEAEVPMEEEAAAEEAPTEEAMPAEEPAEEEMPAAEVAEDEQEQADSVVTADEEAGETSALPTSTQSPLGTDVAGAGVDADDGAGRGDEEESANAAATRPVESDVSEYQSVTPTDTGTVIPEEPPQQLPITKFAAVMMIIGVLLLAGAIVFVIVRVVRKR